jgi:peroxiredoxin/outer membrane lipoprotein-sorting protein
MKLSCSAWIVCLVGMTLGAGAEPPTAAAPTSAPTTAPTTAPATQPAARKVEAKIAADAQVILDKVAKAYGSLKTLELQGSTSFDTDISGKKEHETDGFTASFAAPNKFRHEMKGNMLAGSTGEKAYVHALEDNAFAQKNAPKDRVAAAEAPRVVWDVVMLQNPSLAMALARDASAQLIDSATAFAVSTVKQIAPLEIEKATELKKLADVKLGDKTFTAIQLTNTAGVFTFAFDPETSLLRQMTIDQADFLKHIGQPDVKTAMITVDYTSSKTGGQLTDAQFAWTPPAGARELTAAAAENEPDAAVLALTGKPAPTFTLTDLAKKEVSLADQKGSVVIIDFWATWCGPCVESLPQLNKLYEEKKAAGLKVLAVSVDEDAAKVPLFVAEKKLTFPVLVDNDQQKVAEKYSVQGIPQTVIVGKDGVVKKVFVGYGPGSEDEMRKIVEEAMK